MAFLSWPHPAVQFMGLDPLQTTVVLLRARTLLLSLALKSHFCLLLSILAVETWNVMLFSRSLIMKRGHQFYSCK